MKNIELCISICKYDLNFFEGQVCIGCFREQYEIRNWHKMPKEERKLAKEDILLRKMKYKS